VEISRSRRSARNVRNARCFRAVALSHRLIGGTVGPLRPLTTVAALVRRLQHQLQRHQLQRQLWRHQPQPRLQLSIPSHFAQTTHLAVARAMRHLHLLGIRVLPSARNMVMHGFALLETVTSSGVGVHSNRSALPSILSPPTRGA